MAEKQKQIIDYTPATTLATGDKLLLQKADGSTMNVDYAELARNIITQYNAQTLAGSAQSVQSAFAALNSNLTPLTRVDAVTDLNDATGNNRIYRFNTGALNNPGYNYGLVQVWAEGSNLHQLAVPRGGTASVGMSERSRGSDGTWGEWFKIPTRAEFDTLNSKIVTLPMTPIGGLDTEEKINAAYNNAHTSVSNQTYYKRLLNHGMGHSLFGGGRWYLEGYKESDTYGWQVITSYTTDANTHPIKRYERSMMGGQWTAWEKAPLRSEIDALNNSIANNLQAKLTVHNISVATTFAIPNSYRGILYVTDSSDVHSGEYILFATGTGGVGYKALSTPTDLTLTCGTRELIMTPSSGTRTILFVTTSITDVPTVKS